MQGRDYLKLGANGLVEEFTVMLRPLSMLPELPALAQSLNDRMHELLERSTEGALVETERAELETLVQAAQVVQILAMATQGMKAA